MQRNLIFLACTDNEDDDGPQIHFTILCVHVSVYIYTVNYIFDIQIYKKKRIFYVYIKEIIIIYKYLYEACIHEYNKVAHFIIIIIIFIIILLKVRTNFEHHHHMHITA
jgi:hypothetical protein